MDQPGVSTRCQKRGEVLGTAPEFSIRMPATSAIVLLAAFCKSTKPPKPPCFWDRPTAVSELNELLSTSKPAVLAVRDKAKHSALNIAAFHLNVAGVQALIAAGADVNNPDINNHRPLHHTALSPHGKARSDDQLAIVRALIAAGAKADAKDKQNQAPYQICEASREARGCGTAVAAELRRGET